MNTPSVAARAILSKFGKLKNGGGDWYATKCPAHDDKSGDSLHIREAVTPNTKRPVLVVRCHAGCSTDAVWGAVGLTKADALLDKGNTPLNRQQPIPRPSQPAQTASRPTPPAERRLVKEIRYPLHDGSGKEIAYHIRREYDNGTKAFGWERDGRPTLGDWKVVDMPLYGVPLHMDQGLNMLFVVEGEKAAESLWNRGVTTAVGTVTGAAACPSEKALAPLLIADVWLWPDNDGYKPDNPKASFAGQKHMNAIAARLTLMGRVPGIVLWPEAPPKGDAADHPGGEDEIYNLWRQGVVWHGGHEEGEQWIWNTTCADIEEEARRTLWTFEHQGEQPPMNLEALYSGQPGNELPV